MARALKATIDPNALAYNLNQIRKQAPNRLILAMIKANGYGHGLITTAKALHQADAFGVACIEEALQLRDAGIVNRIVLMEGFFNAEELPNIIQWSLETVVHHENHVAALRTLKHLELTNSPIRVWIKIDTGMHRLGFPVEVVQGVWESLSQIQGIKIEGFLSHFACADELNNPETSKQIERFSKTLQHLPGARSLANSAGILAWPSAHCDWVRPGIMLYGVSPFEDRVGADEGLKPVMTLQSEVIALHDLKRYDAVGYGGTFVCPSDMRIGVIAVGYGDGYPRLAPSGSPVLVNGKQVPLIGRVSMDMIQVDLSSQPEAKIGDPVILWGPELPVEKVASGIGTTAYELLTGLSVRVPFIVKDCHVRT